MKLMTNHYHYKLSITTKQKESGKSADLRPLELIGVTKEERENWPLKSIGKPVIGLFSLASDIALVTTLSNLLEDDVKPSWKGCTDDMWHALVSLFHGAALELPPRITAPDLKSLQEEKTEGLTAAICRLGAAVVAISNKWDLALENRDPHEIRASMLIHRKMYSRSHKGKFQCALTKMDEVAYVMTQCLYL